MTGRTYIAENGTEITDELVDKWAEEAENGFPDAEVTPFEGRAWETDTEPLKPRTIRLSDTMWHLIEADAKRHHMTVSAWARAAMTDRLSRHIDA
ncbi:hypothetical protein [Bifidobacterium simiarum]|uniref:CopG family transcriptional regulator n=1 Tax=Bifidobacterium simiarum TaxID=2045441 RepID=A0A2M9HGA1_9BIFI|nr:hypothetical protein [Bifidobacterium simiarum]PJM75842.1 hypothetical protein CSQ87_02960 [Bifidobacterium simiarum]